LTARSSGISAVKCIHARFIEARIIGVRHRQVIEPVRPLHLFLPALLVDFRDCHLGEPVRSLHIARSGLGGETEGLSWGLLAAATTPSVCGGSGFDIFA
jgi:hypothetical protein